MAFFVPLHRNYNAGQKLSTAPGTRRSTPIYIIVQVREGIFIPIIIMSKKSNLNRYGWNRNTDLSVSLKTILRRDHMMKTGKEYQGVLRRDSDSIVDEFFCRDAHYTFVETLPWTMKRNPRVFRGKYISITRRHDGSLRPNFLPVKMSDGFSLAEYAIGVSNELLWGLEGLVEK